MKFVELYDRKKLNVVYQDDRIQTLQSPAVLELDGKVLKYKPLDSLDISEERIVLHKTEKEFLQDPEALIEISIPAKLCSKLDFLNISSYHFDSQINVEHIDPSKKISAETVKALSDAFMTAQFFNDTAFISDHKKPTDKMTLSLPSSPYMNDSYTENICKVNIDEYLHIVYSDNGDVIGGEYYKDGKVLFSVKADFYYSLYEKTLRTRYILSAYDHLNPGECLGIKIDLNGNKTLLAASIDEGIKIREIPGFTVYPTLTAHEAHPPYFIINDGLFYGRGPKSIYTAPEPKGGDYLPIFIGWAEEEENLFMGPEDTIKHRSDNIREP